MNKRKPAFQFKKNIKLLQVSCGGSFRTYNSKIEVYYFVF